MLSMAIGVLAFGADALAVFAEIIPTKNMSDTNDVQHTVREIKSCAAWSWYTWGAASLVLLSMSSPITASWGATDWIPGGTTMAQVNLCDYSVWETVERERDV